MNLLIKSITDPADYQLVMQKMEKACKSAYAQSCLLQETNKDLLTAARRQHQRATRTKGHWGAGRVMNLDVIEERAEKARSKAKDKKDKQMNKELNQTIKAFCRLDPSLFLEANQRSPIKSRSMKNSSTRPILLSSTLTSPVRISSPGPVRRHRKQVQMPFRGVEQAKEVAPVIQMSRVMAGITQWPRRRDRNVQGVLQILS